MNLKKPPACIRCGMCCLAAPCLFSEVGESLACVHLAVNEDNTTTCLNEAANKEYVGVGCIFMRPQAKEVYDLHMELYSVNERKRELAGG